MLGQNGFGVELYPFHVQETMAQAHDGLHLALVGFGPRGDFKAFRQGFLGDDQAMVAGGGQRVGQIGEDAHTGVLNQAGLAVHNPSRTHHVTAKHGTDSLVAQANAQYRQASCKMRTLLLLALTFSSAFGFVAGPTRPALIRQTAARAIAPVALLPAELLAEAPPMKDGAMTVAIGGGILAILTAGIPVLFMMGKDKQTDVDTRIANMEQGLGSAPPMQADEEEFEGLEIIDEPAESSK